METVKDVLKKETLQRGYVEISCEFKHQTEKAILINDGDIDIWIPKKFVNGFDPLTEKGEHIEIIIKEWFAIKEGIV